jgi:hypothetical protein
MYTEEAAILYTFIISSVHLSGVEASKRPIYNDTEVN